MKNRNTLKILMPILSFGRAGGMRVLSQLANHWNIKGCDVTFVAFHESEDPYYPVNVKVIWIDNSGKEMNNNTSTYNAQNSGFKRMYALYMFLKKYSIEYDIVLANSNNSTWPVWLGSKSTNYYYIQAYEVEFSDGKNIKALLKRFTAWLTYFLPLHKVVNAEVYKNYKNIKCKLVIPPGLDLNIYYPKKILENYNNEFIVGCIGRKAEWKGSNDVGEAVKILRSKGYKVKLKVAFESIKYTEHELVKPDGDENLADYYRSLDVLIAPGHIQLGAVHYPVIEAMACKVPVITTGYYPATIENSFLVPIKRPDVIADTLVDIIGNYVSAIIKAEIAYTMISQFDWKVVSAKFLDIFNDELRRRK